MKTFILSVLLSSLVIAHASTNTVAIAVSAETTNIVYSTVTPTLKLEKPVTTGFVQSVFDRSDYSSNTNWIGSNKMGEDFFCCNFLSKDATVFKKISISSGPFVKSSYPLSISREIDSLGIGWNINCKIAKRK